MPTPSLILVPARFKTGKLYTPLATTSGGVVLGASGDFNVTRATTATRVNASGLIEVVASGIPRLDYPIGGGCPALLVEPSGSNVIVQSQNWLASGWRSDATANVTTVSATTGTLDPLGTNTANAISPTSGSTSHLKVGSDGAISFTSGTIYTASAFFKQGTGDAGRYVQITQPIGTFTQGFYANFDLQLGTISATGSVSADTNRAASIENYGNGWYRCRLTATCNAGGSAGSAFALISSSGSTRTLSFSGTTTDILYGWGAQVETGSVATSYIPTTTASATRNAEVISLSGAVSGCIGQTEGTIYVEVDTRATGGTLAKRFLTISAPNSDSDRISIGKTAIDEIVGAILVDGVEQALISTASNQSGIFKIAFAYAANDAIMFVNGTQVGLQDTSVILPSSISHIGLASNTIGTRQFNDRIRAAALYTTRLTNAELAALTTL
jgi:hypothetical protein